MIDSTHLIRKYFHTSKSAKLGNVIEQIDYISALVANILQADFTALFYKKDGNDNLIPLAYHNETEIEIIDFKQLENRWTSPEIIKVEISKEFLNFDVKSSVEHPTKDSFTYKHNFEHYFQFPYYINGQLRCVVIAYWQKPPDVNISEVEKVLNNLLRLLISTMAGAGEIQLLNDYSLKLSELIGMFEIPVGEYRFKKLVSKLIFNVRKVVPGAGFFLFSHDNKTNSYQLNEYYDAPQPKLAIVNAIVKKIDELYNEANKPDNTKGNCIDISDNYQNQYTGVFVLPMWLDLKDKIVLVTCTNEINGFTQNDEELLSIFCLFCQAILKNASLVKNLTKTNRLLKKSTNQLANVETLAALADMTSGVAHDFNNMIGGVVGRVQLMKLNVKDESLLRNLNKIESLVLDGAETLRRIQEFSINAKYKKTEKIDLSEVVKLYFKKTDLKWKETAALKNITVDSKSFVDEAIIEGVTDDINTILDKLIGNAVEHAFENSSIAINIMKEKKYYTITVSNKGFEIDKQIRKKIFYPFFSTKSIQGAGLGLAIVHGIIVRHGGRIDFESSSQHGTVFNVKFPIPDLIIEDSEISRKHQKVSNLRILIVDDDEQIREVLSDMLTIEGHVVTACSDGSEALKECEKNEYDLMITDLGMPGMSGFDLAGLVHENKPDLPIAMITGWGTQLNQEEIALKGIKVVLPKPFHLKDIKVLIQEVVLNL